MKSIHETVPGPRLVSVAATNIPQNADAIVKHEGQRGARSTGHHAAVDGALRRRAAPGRVSVDVVGRADSPEVFAVVGKFVAKRQAKEFVSLRGLDGILEIICVRIALVAEIKPRV